ncbi:carbohydrate ABC transporter permease [Lederbergia citrea]|uniref:Carbohydrate ABC transporter permease n=1 Tax=Lederbergia citrea TaxID=2833581 RepID=A0A942UP28_9BACI|nr:carbohydrate ABC transporter permease [Lederbergia citrea]MBS4178736.1 carbohydrate ABC transporter permease [Lederbergia citrea]MBS4205442.1 carbohydrate ABC transporter permease [Lederbergia citrea]MBS4224240.1 carbohydrate ABC transporter permease [Lederbergia citrea]
MVADKSIGYRIFLIINYTLLALLALTCLLPLCHVLAVSLSSKAAVTAGSVKFLPVDFTLASYKLVIAKPQFITSMLITVKRVLLGVGINMILVVLTAYPLSKEVKTFRSRTIFSWFFVFTMFFGGGLIPSYIVIKSVGIIDTIWALVLPGALQIFSVVLLLNFFRGIPKELEESAFMDGAGHFSILFKIYLPASLPALATLTLFSIVYHWNSWFDGLIYMNSPENYPLQSYMQTIIVKMDQQFMRGASKELIKSLNEQTLKSAQVFLGSLPILLVYPFLQKYFVKGIVLGSVKG